MRQSRYWTLPACQALSWAWFEGYELHNPVIGPGHILLGLAHHEGSASQLIATRSAHLSQRLKDALRRPAGGKRKGRVDRRFTLILASAQDLARSRQDPAVGTGHLLSALLRIAPTLAPELGPLLADKRLFDLASEVSKGKLVRNSRWRVEYETAPRSTYGFSKFGIGEARMTIKDLARCWPRWSQSTRSQFALDFNAQCNWGFGPVERKIARFIAQEAKGIVRVNSSSYLVRIPPREAFRIITRWLNDTEDTGALLKEELNKYLEWAKSSLEAKK